MCTTLPPVLVSDPRDREARADVRRPRGLPAAAAALVDRRADEPVHVALDRRHRRATGRRSSTSCCSTRAARACSPTRSAGSGAALHPLQRVPQRLPGVLADRRPRVRLGLSRPDRRDPHAAADRHRERAVAAVRVDPLRRLLRGLPGEDRHPERAAAPARARSSSTRAVGRAARDARARVESSASSRRLRLAQRLGRIAQRAVRPQRLASAGCPARSPAGRRRATCGPSRGRASATGGAGADDERARRDPRTRARRARAARRPQSRSRAPTGAAATSPAARSSTSSASGSTTTGPRCAASPRRSARGGDRGYVRSARGSPHRRPAGLPAAWRPADAEVVEDARPHAARARRARRRRHRLHARDRRDRDDRAHRRAGRGTPRADARPRPARLRRRARARSSSSCPRRSRGSPSRRASAAAHARLGPVGDLRHRAQPRRGRPRPAHARRARRRLDLYRG